MKRDEVHTDEVRKAYTFSFDRTIEGVSADVKGDCLCADGATIKAPDNKKGKPDISPLHTSQANVKGLNGKWAYIMTPAGGNVIESTLTMSEMEDNLISGNLTVNDNTKTYIIGSFDGANLILIRETGLETMQVYTLVYQRDIDGFIGTYRNVGKYSDSGTIKMFRPRVKLK